MIDSDNSRVGDANVDVDVDVQAPASLRLRLTHHQGHAASASFAISEGGAGLAGALELVGEPLSEAQWHAANRCSIVRGEGSWQLVNASPSVVCAVNGQRVTARAPVTLAAGDVLELGLLRFEVEEGSSAHTSADEQPIATPRATKLVVAPRAIRATPESSEFDMRDLATLSSSVLDGATQAASASDPFAVLNLSGATRSEARSPLAVLLGEIPAFEARPASAAEDARHDAPADDAASRESPRHGSMFSELHEEYLRVVHDPGELASRANWSGPTEASGGADAPSLEELSRCAEPFALLRDILLPRDAIDAVIDEFDTRAAPTLLIAPAIDEVLRLFAPESARPLQARVPSLTQREHHELSLDSHVRIGQFERNEPGRAMTSLIAPTPAQDGLTP